MQKRPEAKLPSYWRVHVHLQETVKVDIRECNVPSIDAGTLNLIAAHSPRWLSSNLRYTRVVLALMAGRRIISLDLTVSNRRYACLLSSCQVRGSTYHDHRYGLQDAFQCIAQPRTTLLDCILYYNTSMMQAFHQALQISACLGRVSEIQYQDNSVAAGHKNSIEQNHIAETSQCKINTVQETAMHSKSCIVSRKPVRVSSCVFA